LNFPSIYEQFNVKLNELNKQMDKFISVPIYIPKNQKNQGSEKLDKFCRLKPRPEDVVCRRLVTPYQILITNPTTRLNEINAR